MFLAAFVFITHGTKQVQVDGLIKRKGAFSLKKETKAKQSKTNMDILWKSKGKKRKKSAKKPTYFFSYQ